MPRFAISHHVGGPEGAHYDLFLEVASALKTWRISRPSFEAPQPATAIDDHRLRYLEFEGPVSDNRGQVALWDRGEYDVDVWKDDRIIVALRGARLHTRLQLNRARDQWTVVDAAVPLRRAAAALFREAALDVAPNAELEPFCGALGEEGRRLLALVDAYAKGRDVTWASASTDGALRARLRSEHARWRHPWLHGAIAHAERLDEIVRLLNGAKP